MERRQLTEADLYEFKQMCSGKYGPQWTAIRKLVDEVRGLRRDLLATQPAGIIRNSDLDNVLIASTRLHTSLLELIAKLRPIPIGEALAQRNEEAPAAQPQEPKATTVPKTVLSMSEAAESLGISRSKLYGLIQNRELHSFRIGGRRLVPQKAIDDFIGAASD